VLRHARRKEVFERTCHRESHTDKIVGGRGNVSAGTPLSHRTHLLPQAAESHEEGGRQVEVR